MSRSDLLLRGSKARANNAGASHRSVGANFAISSNSISKSNSAPSQLGSTKWAARGHGGSRRVQPKKVLLSNNIVAASSFIAAMAEEAESRSLHLKTHLFNTYLQSLSDLLTRKEAASKWSKTKSIIGEWSALQHDWDGEEALAPTRDQVRAINMFVERAELAGVREPRAYISSDTEMGFHWDGQEKASVSFLHEGKFLAFCPAYLDEPAIRVVGPLDLAAASTKLFEALAKHA